MIQPTESDSQISPQMIPGARFSVYTPETSCMKKTFVYIENLWIKQLCNRNVPDFAMASRARKVSGALEKQGYGSRTSINLADTLWPRAHYAIGVKRVYRHGILSYFDHRQI